MSYKTSSQSRESVDTAKNSQISATLIDNYNSGATNGPVITSVIITDSGWNALDDTAVGTSNSYIKIIGTGFSSGANVFVGGTQVPVSNVTFTSSTELRITLPVLTVGTYNTISLFNTSGSGAIYASTLLASGFPSFSSTSYNSESLTISVQLLASGDGTLSYSLKPGSSLPAGLTLSPNGLISGTTTNNTTSTFTVLVDDSQNQTIQQDITLTINGLDPYFNYTTLLLQADYTSNNSNNGVFVDSSNNNLTITTPYSMPYQGSFNPFGTGTWSNYFTANGISVAASSNVAVGTSDFTFEAWIYPISMITWQSIVSTRNTASTAGATDVWCLGFNSTGYPYIYSGDFQATGSANTVANTTWTHVAVSRSGSTMRLFVNGVVANTATSSQNYTNNTITIGSNGDGSEYFNGYISNARLIKGTALYTSNFTPSTTPLTAVANTVLLTCQSNQFKDESTNNLSITPKSYASIEKFNPFALNLNSYDVSSNTFVGSTYFNGTTDYLTWPSGTTAAFGTGDFTVEMWVNLSTDQVTGKPVLIDFRNSGQTTAPAFICRSSVVTGALSWYNGSSYLATDSSTTRLGTNTWHHIAYSRTGGTGYLMVDGQLVNSLADSTNYTISPTTSYIGSNYTPGAFFNGYISNLRIIKGTALYTSSFTPSTTPLTAVANTVLLTCQNNQTANTDISNNNITITIGGTPKPTTKLPFTVTDTSSITTNYSGSVYFNGANTNLLIPYTTNLHLGASDFTIEFWYYPNSIPAANSTHIINHGGGVGIGYASYEIILDHPTKKIRFSATSTNTSYDIGGESSSGDVGIIASNTWNHIAITRSGSTFRGFVNGVQGFTATSSATLYDTTPRGLSIGSNYTNSWGTPASLSNVVNGYISNLRIIKGNALYISNFTPSTTPLIPVANTQLLLLNKNSGIYDGTLQNNIKTNAAAKIRKDVFKYGTGSIYFNGGENILIPYNRNIWPAKSDFTIEFWIYPTSLSGSFVYVMNMGGGPGIAWATWEIYINLSTIRFAASTTNTGYDIGGESATGNIGTLTLNAWNHIAITRSGSTFRGFVNGVQGFTATSTSALFDPNPRGLSIGSGYTNVWDSTPLNSPFLGYLDDIRITKGYARYTANFTPPTLALKNK